jgi:hypothetical protein
MKIALEFNQIKFPPKRFNERRLLNDFLDNSFIAGEAEKKFKKFHCEMMIKIFFFVRVTYTSMFPARHTHTTEAGVDVKFF